MRVGELARRTGVGVSTLRAWEHRFAFLEPRRTPAGHREYDEADVERVHAVTRLVAEGLTLPAAIARVASAGTGALPEGEAESLLYSQILQAAAQGIWVIRDGRTRFANRRMAEMMHCSVEELVEFPVLEIFTSDMLPTVRERTERVRAGQRLHFTQQLRRADGTTFVAEVNTTPLFNQAGRYEGAVALVDDVTTRHEAEGEALLRATLLDSIGEAVVAGSADGAVVYVNQAAERLFGWRAADAVGRHARDLFPSPEDPKYANRIVASLEKGRGFSGRYRMLRRDGSEFVAQLTAAPMLDPKGTYVGAVGVISDQTAHDELERALATRERQWETLALLGVQALRRPAGPAHSATTVITEVVEATRRLLDGDRAMMLDHDVESDTLLARVVSPTIDTPIVLPSGSRSFAGYVALARRAIVVDNTRHDGRFDAGPSTSDITMSSAIGAPIFGPDGIVGVLVADSPEPGAFAQSDAPFIQGMANIIGIALLG